MDQMNLEGYKTALPNLRVEIRPGLKKVVLADDNYSGRRVLSKMITPPRIKK